MLELTQRKEIREYLRETTWPYINDNILTNPQRGNPEEMKYIAFDMEEILKSFAAEFGLSALMS